MQLWVQNVRIAGLLVAAARRSARMSAALRSCELSLIGQCFPGL